MRLFHRRDAPPAEVLAHLPRGERVVSWADLVDGGVVVATPAGLWWPDADAYRLIDWPHIIKATWRDARLTIFEADVVDDLLLVDRVPVSAGFPCRATCRRSCASGSRRTSSIRRSIRFPAGRHASSPGASPATTGCAGGPGSTTGYATPPRSAPRWPPVAISSPPSTRRVELSASALHWGSNRTHRTPSRRRPAAPGG